MRSSMLRPVLVEKRKYNPRKLPIQNLKIDSSIKYKRSSEETTLNKTRVI